MQLFTNRKIHGAQSLPLWIGAGIFALFASSCGSKKPAGAGGRAMPKPTVVATVVKPATYTVTEEFPASLIANHVINLTSDVTGYLKAIRVADGSNVSKGQLLYEIDQSRYAAGVDQSKASLAQAQAQLAQTQLDYDRYKALLEKDATSRQTVDQAETALKTAKANVAAAQAVLDKTNTDLSHSNIRSPMNGKIGIALIRVGDIVNAGQTVINTIVNEEPIYADIDIPQQRYKDFADALGSNKYQYTLKFSDGSIYPEKGKLLLVNNAVDATTGTIRVRISFTNNKNMLKSGMTAVLQMTYQTQDSQIAIPSKAIKQTLGEIDVFTVDENNVVKINPVSMGAIIDTMQIVNSGLKAGDKVITEGIQKIRPGDTVQVQLR
ncbi:efflux transporter periplasmic adaptor subunit [Chitinophaga caeni]|uniref:Efflux transporter periplasmic adaptor subunit n=1 Tax=Chitinophaga caeni TaxID=2029983 RepID=A0A291QPN0_9BACT|nr:efflux RND transporter periplasmic adaptor subunit [Chitinophaga caeni]ATL45853.1 efflux transporter periplasmic adaptor subunit [Chitinophaga caeni]